MWVPPPFPPCPTLPLPSCCVHITIQFSFVRQSFCVYMKIVFVVFSFSAVFCFRFCFSSIFTAHFYSQTNFLTSNWQKLTSARAMDRQMYGEHTQHRQREREMERGTPTNGLSVSPTDRQISVSVSGSSVRPQAEPFAMPACLPHVKDDSSCEKVNIQTRPFSHAESQSVPLSLYLSHCPTVSLSCVVCRAELLPELLLLLPHFPMAFQLKRNEKCGLRTKTIVAKSTALLEETEREWERVGVQWSQADREANIDKLNSG